MAKKSDKPEEAAAGAPDEGKDKKAKEPKEGKEPKGKTAPDKGGKPEKGEKPPKADKAPGNEKTAPAEKPAGEAKPAAAEGAPGEPKKKGKRPGATPRRGKKLRNKIKDAEQKIAKEGLVPIKRAIQLLKQFKRAKFDETVEVHMWLGIDATQSDQAIRGSVALPHGLGKAKRVIVFCQGDNVAKAKEAGADFAGSDDLIEKIQKENWLDFDIALATQDLMGKVSRLGKVLGPRGLMPTPKAGTVVPPTADIAGAVREFKAGKIEYRTDKGGNVHAGVGKLSFDESKLEANITAFVDQIKAAKPSGVKGNYLKSVTLTATMSPGVRLTV
jgi:large subunit ribosomal protein L1